MTLPVLYMHELVWRLALDGKNIVQMQESEAQAELVRSGQKTAQEVWGPSMDADQFRAWCDSMVPGFVHRYRLPKGWHWMGEKSVAE